MEISATNAIKLPSELDRRGPCNRLCRRKLGALWTECCGRPIIPEECQVKRPEKMPVDGLQPHEGDFEPEEEWWTRKT